MSGLPTNKITAIRSAEAEVVLTASKVTATKTLLIIAGKIIEMVKKSMTFLIFA